MTGIDKAREVAESLKQQNKEKVEKDQQAMVELKTQLTKIQDDPELMRMYQESAGVGADNLSGELPLLKIYSTGRSIATLKDGSEPKNGSFYYKPLQKEFGEVTCHILTISRGFRAEGMADKKTGKTEPKFNQVMGGVIVDDNNFLPFIMYFTGKKLSKLWDFGKEVSKYTKMKPVPIPMFALTVKMKTVQETTDYGKVWLVDFEIVKNEDGFPIVIGDQTMFQYLKKSVVAVEDTITSLIESKSVAETEELQETKTVKPTEDIPF